MKVEASDTRDNWSALRLSLVIEKRIKEKGSKSAIRMLRVGWPQWKGHTEEHLRRLRRDLEDNPVIGIKPPKVKLD
jgi:hypothetical protein